MDEICGVVMEAETFGAATPNVFTVGTRIVLDEQPDKPIIVPCIIRLVKGDNILLFNRAIIDPETGKEKRFSEEYVTEISVCRNGVKLRQLSLPGFL